jgi:LuxR family maltose regulon positive regulatory protein
VEISQFVFAVTFVLGDTIIAFSLLGAFVRELMSTRPSVVSDNVKHLTTLTERQRQIATLACQGLSNKELAQILGLAEGTVKIHLNAIYTKLGARSKIDLMVRFGVLRRVAV